MIVNKYFRNVLNSVVLCKGLYNRDQSMSLGFLLYNPTYITLHGSKLS